MCSDQPERRAWNMNRPKFACWIVYFAGLVLCLVPEAVTVGAILVLGGTIAVDVAHTSDFNEAAA